MIGFWDHLWLVPTVTVTFVKVAFVLATYIQIRNISAVTDLILIFGPNFLGALVFGDPILFWHPILFWPNVEGRFLEPYLTDANYQGDICQGNICPGDICPYQEYLTCYWPDFYQTLKVGSWYCLEQISTIAVAFVQATFVPATFVHIRNISAVTYPILTKLQM